MRIVPVFVLVCDDCKFYSLSYFKLLDSVNYLLVKFQFSNGVSPIALAINAKFFCSKFCVGEVVCNLIGFENSNRVFCFNWIRR